MAIGPVQLVVVGFNHSDFHGEIIAELENLRERDAVRVIDSIVVYKDAAGAIEVEHLSNLSLEEVQELGSRIGALIGLAVDGEEDVDGAARPTADVADAFGEDAWDVLAEIPNGSAAALILLEHHWAVPLRETIARTGGFRISDGFISPLDLVDVGLLTAEEAQELHVMETCAQAAAH